jgi:hypothetical protein
MSRQALAIRHVEKQGILLVFAIDNRREPLSLWFCLHPRSQMRWEWDDSGDDRVAQLWHLRGELSTSRQIIYCKWYKGRATLVSKPVYAAILAASNSRQTPTAGLSPTAQHVLRVLEGESPLSTKELKIQCGLKGKANETLYQKALRELWTRALIVAFGEVEDGAFPSLAIGATRVLFEDLWKEAWELSPDEVDARIQTYLPKTSLFGRELERNKKAIPAHANRSTKPLTIPSVINSESLEPLKGRRPRHR